MRPNPGSNAALAAGCLCPVIDNGYGKGSGWGPNAFWINGDCPLHNHRPAGRDETLQAEGAPQGAPPGAATAVETVDPVVDSSLEEPDPWREKVLTRHLKCSS